MQHDDSGGHGMVMMMAAAGDGGRWRTTVVGGSGEQWQSLDGRGQLDSSSICFWWQGGKMTTAAVGDVKVKGSNAIIYDTLSLALSYFSSAKLAKDASTSRKSPGSPQEVLSQLGS
jgi:hypothetical protein